MTDSSNLLARIAELEAREAIKELAARYCWHVVRGEAQAVSELYLPDGSFDVPSAGARLRFTGRDAIRDRVALNPPGQEVPMVTNHIIEIDGDTATATVAMRTAGMANGAAKPILSGYYRDRYRRVDGAWFFEERRWFTYAPTFAVE